MVVEIQARPWKGIPKYSVGFANLLGDMGFGFATRTGSGIDQTLGTGAGLAKVKTMVMQFMLEVY